MGAHEFRRGRSYFPRPGGTPDYFTNFSTTENPVDEGGRWLNGLREGASWNDCQVSSGRLCATHTELSTPPFDDCNACINPAFRQYNPNQFARGTVFRTPGYTAGHEILLFVRKKISSGSAPGYEVYWTTNGGGVVNLVRWNGPLNNFTGPLAFAATSLPSSGDVLRVEIIGTVITVSVNGAAPIITYDDAGASQLNTGNPGIGNNPFDPTSTFFDFGWDDFTCGNL